MTPAERNFNLRYIDDYGYRRESEKWTKADVVLFGLGALALFGWVCFVNYFFPL